MRSLYDFIVEPIGSRYNNKKQIGDKQLIINTEIGNLEKETLRHSFELLAIEMA